MGITSVDENGESINIEIIPAFYVICDNTFLKKCVARISKLDILNIAIFGDTFMMAFYNVFDIENSRIGFA